MAHDSQVMMAAIDLQNALRRGDEPTIVSALHLLTHENPTVSQETKLRIRTLHSGQERLTIKMLADVFQELGLMIAIGAVTKFPAVERSA